MKASFVHTEETFIGLSVLNNKYHNNVALTIQSASRNVVP